MQIRIPLLYILQLRFQLTLVFNDASYDITSLMLANAAVEDGWKGLERFERALVELVDLFGNGSSGSSSSSSSSSSSGSDTKDEEHESVVSVPAGIDLLRLNLSPSQWKVLFGIEATIEGGDAEVPVDIIQGVVGDVGDVGDVGGIGGLGVVGGLATCATNPGVCHSSVLLQETALFDLQLQGTIPPIPPIPSIPPIPFYEYICFKRFLAFMF